MAHPRVVNSAYFSPRTGHKILTTAQDNRIRIWDYHLSAGDSPSREIVHSHDFNRYLTPFRAEWMPGDPCESLIVCGRYISEDFGGVALHPVDIMDACTGALMRELVDPNMPTISPVNKAHPRRDVIISGSSRSLYLWAPAPGDDADAEAEADEAGAAAAAGPSTSSVPATQAARAAALMRRAGVYSGFVAFDADPGGGKGGDEGGKGGGKRRKRGGGGADDDD